MSNNPPPPITAADLVTVAYDRRKSTRLTQVYRATSDTHIGRTYTVRHDLRGDTWRCECAGAYHPDCKHRRRARTLALARWWEALLDGYTVPQLRGVADDKRGLLRVGLDVEESAAALIAVEALLLAAGEDDAIAA